MLCAKHGVETEVSCGRCGTPVCPKCMRHTDVGVRCKNCAGDHIGRPAAGNTSRVVLIGAIVLGVLVAAGALGSGVFSSSRVNAPDLSDFASQFSAHTTASQIVDPWLPGTGGSDPRQNYRYVAIEVVAENQSDQADATIFADASTYTLSDENDFVYAPIREGGAQPELSSVQLDKGKKAHGWITFEMPADAKVASLNDYTSKIDLPN
ncbi:MAG: DUF4352 domain-containing protein [Chloroflexota bacterium]